MMSSTLVPGDILAGRYRILRPLGLGGFGQLFVAEQISMSREVAVKVVLPRLVHDAVAIDRFRLEAQAACQVKHPNLVVYHDHGEDQHGRLFLVMELIDGETLAALLARTPLLPVTRALAIATQICDALAATHRAGIVHRDLKPANVMLLSEGPIPDYVKVIDFGILKELVRRREGDAPNITGTNEIVGTPEYLAPEIAAGKRFDGRADQYSLGVLLFEMLAGHRPFRRPDPIQTILAHLREPAPKLSAATPGRRLPPGLDEVVARTLMKEPAARYESMAGLRRALAAALALASSGTSDEPTQVELGALDTPSAQPIYAVSEGPLTISDLTPLDGNENPETPAAATALASASAPRVEVHAAALRPRATLRVAAALALVALAGALLALFLPGRAPSLGDRATEEVVSAPRPASGGYQHVVSPASARESEVVRPPAPSPPEIATSPRVGNDPPAPLEEVPAPPRDITPEVPATAAAAALSIEATAGGDEPRPRSRRSAPRRLPGRVAGEKAPAERPPGRGALSVNAIPYARVTVGGDAFGDTPVVGVSLAAGRHRVRAIHPTLGERVRLVEIRPGETTRVTFDFRGAQ